VDLKTSFRPGADTLGADTGGVLTLGSLVHIVQTGTNAAVGESTSTTGGPGAMISNADIQAAFNGGRFSIGGTSFTNLGSIGVSNGDLLLMDALSFTNSGTLTVASGGVVSLGGTVTVAELGAIKNTGGLIEIGNGTLNLGATVLDVGTGSTLGELGLGKFGGIANGTSHDGGGGLAVSNGDLSNVTYEGGADDWRRRRPRGHEARPQNCRRGTPGPDEYRRAGQHPHRHRIRLH
jgi:fibronectin-binding autotransporter adhesin